MHGSLFRPQCVHEKGINQGTATDVSGICGEVSPHALPSKPDEYDRLGIHERALERARLVARRQPEPSFRQLILGDRRSHAHSIWAVGPGQRQGS